MKRLGAFAVCLALVLFSFSAFAQRGDRGGYCSGRPYISVSSNGEQITLSGQGFCDSSSYRIRVSNNYNGNDNWYVSNNGNSQWNVNGGGTFSHTIARRYMTPGNLFQLITYSRSGYATHYFTKQLPCRLEEVVVFFQNPFTWNYDAGVVTVVNCGGYVPVPGPGPGPVIPAPIAQSCQVGFDKRGYEVGVRVNCTLIGQSASITVINRDNRAPVCTRHFITTSMESEVCTIGRDPTQHVAYEYELRSLDYYSHDAKMITKDASFLSLPDGQYTSQTELAPQNNKQKWEAFISVRVSDNDVDAAENQRLIPVQLINATNGAVVESKYANTGQEVRFRFYRKAITSWHSWFNKNEFQGNLNEGENKFFVRVKDAYEGTATKDLPTVTVRVN